jgi:hypothetical protein
MASLLTKLVKQRAFCWDQYVEKTFNQSKYIITHPSTLALLDFSKPFIVKCDISGVGIWAVLIFHARWQAFIFFK